MRAVCIIASPRKNGSTAYIMNSLIKGLLESNYEIKKYYICDCIINQCKGCKKCYKDGYCVYQDDVELIVSDMLSSDLVVVGSPSYWGDVTGSLKVFIDRNTPYGDTNCNRRIVGRGVKGISIAIRAGKKEEENERIIATIEHYFGHLGIESKYRLSVCGVETLDDLLKMRLDKIEEAYNVGKNICKLLNK